MCVCEREGERKIERERERDPLDNFADRCQLANISTFILDEVRVCEREFVCERGPVCVCLCVCACV